MNLTTVVVDKTVLLSILAKQAAANGMIRTVPSRGLSIVRLQELVPTQIHMVGFLLEIGTSSTFLRPNPLLMLKRNARVLMPH